MAFNCPTLKTPFDAKISVAMTTKTP